MSRLPVPAGWEAPTETTADLTTGAYGLKDKTGIDAGLLYTPLNLNVAAKWNQTMFGKLKFVFKGDTDFTLGPILQPVGAVVKANNVDIEVDLAKITAPGLGVIYEAP